MQEQLILATDGRRTFHPPASPLLKGPRRFKAAATDNDDVGALVTALAPYTANTTPT